MFYFSPTCVEGYTAQKTYGVDALQLQPFAFPIKGDELPDSK
jgi:hypothetical protein